MEIGPKFKEGDKVRLNDTGNLTDEQMPFVGKKGTVTEQCYYPYVRFKGCEDWICCNENELQLVKSKPKRHKFDLGRALAGEEVVTRKGEKIASIKVINNAEWCLNGEFENGDTGLFTKEGKYDFNLKKDEYDLFMKHPATESKPVTDLPQYTAELLSQAVPNPVADGIDRLKEELEGKPERDYDKLKKAFSQVLDNWSEMFANHPDPHLKSSITAGQIIANWNNHAGLS